MQFSGAGADKSLSLPLSSTATAADHEEDLDEPWFDSNIVINGTDMFSQQPEHFSGMSNTLMDQTPTN